MSCSILNSPSVTHFKTEAVYNREESMDVSDDASTVVNLSLMKKDKNNVTVEKYKFQPEADNSSTSSKTVAAEAKSLPEPSIPLIDRVDKVAGWLEHLEVKSHEETKNVKAAKQLVSESWPVEKLLNYFDDPLLSNTIRRTEVFLLGVEPSLDYPLNLLSGYCIDGCKRFSNLSSIVWPRQDSQNIPVCPNCAEPGSEKGVLIMFKFQLNVMDTQGKHGTFNVWREHGEEFLGCSAADFLRQRSVREAAVAPMRENTVMNTLHRGHTPMLDVNVIYIKGIYFLVDTRLRRIQKPA